MRPDLLTLIADETTHSTADEGYGFRCLNPDCSGGQFSVRYGWTAEDFIIVLVPLLVVVVLAVFGIHRLRRGTTHSRAK